MSNTLDLSNYSSNGTPYQVKFINQSPSAWIVYLYQKMPNQPSDVFSLAWQASPFKVAPNSFFTFKWSIDYSFIWGRTGALTDGVVFEAGAVLDADPAGNNQVTFDTANNTPAFSNLSSGGQAGKLTIMEGSHMPNNVYSTGIGMSGQGTFVQQVLTNTTQLYTPEPLYYIAAGQGVQMGQVLAQTVTNASELKYTGNVYSLVATLTETQQWSIVPA
ncbi:hypothetical protein [Yersinia mollaretii]|uniref:Protein RhiA n=1 Tax=Yersinia mollaretii (strain ATCC 43969 / DSM 18520 / CIP 103324 / CNY 7263 / WAIP 204) TaxID=349967 RepID=A0ABM9Y6X5_YERMW|nr:hypothetical protein [Yersinia mollaretii]EEQ09580.1 hypothetical protein ymoll0001_13470 [Yersinia mollaretii ATCC 43969]MDN0111598.1 protein RhiA [Yersinia mollaretii]QKJ03644.1 protein RhiA [Yersinia mollaretii ATCC 43969]